MDKRGEDLKDEQELQVISQLVENMEVMVDRLESAYSDKDGTKFKTYKEEILKAQKQIEEMLR